MRPSYLSTLDEIERRVTLREKVASPTTHAPPNRARAEALRGLGALMRKQASLSPNPGYEDLYAVLDGTFSVPELPSPPRLEGAGAPLRKLAHELRTLDHVSGIEMAKSAEDAGRAALGLTLLCDRLGSL